MNKKKKRSSASSTRRKAKKFLHVSKVGGITEAHGYQLTTWQ
jgi:hypothetical protein